jgi:AraC family transcriptional regulator
MLRYLGAGLRRFGLYRIAPHQRVNWEFYAVVQGSIAPVLPGIKRMPLKSSHLWLFAPETAHGWRGDGAHKAHIVVFHFGFVPPPLDEIARRTGYMSVSLTEQEAPLMLEMEEELRGYYQKLTSVSLLHFHKALLELSLVALKNVPVQNLPSHQNAASDKVEAALAWFSEHVAEKPKLAHAARAVHVSSSHLRRLFQQVRKQSPHAAFTQVKMERAMKVLSESEDKLDVVASSCGFSSNVNFCRVFKAHTGFTPDAWRKTRLTYEEPKRRRAAAQQDPTPGVREEARRGRP